LENRRSKTAEEIDHLSIRKKEMELLVKKASLSLFLNEQHEHLQKKIAVFTENNSELKDALRELRDVQEKLHALGVEIESDPNAELLSEVIAASKRRKSSVDEVINDLPPTIRAFANILREFVRAYARILGRIALP
jgi:chromosome segregation ATPase